MTERLTGPTDAEVAALAIVKSILNRSRPTSLTAGDRIQAVILADFVAESVAKMAARSLRVPLPETARCQSCSVI